MMIGILIDMIRIYWLSYNFQSEIFLNAIYLHTLDLFLEHKTVFILIIYIITKFKQR